MEVIGILGDRGSGKTCFLTWLLYRAYLDGHLIINNYTVEFDHVEMPFKELAKLGPKLQDAWIGLDELGQGADAYDFLSKQSRALSDLVQQLRKRNCVLIWTTLRRYLITRRIRELTDYFFLMEDLDKHNPGHTQYNCLCNFRCTVMDAEYRKVNSFDFDGSSIVHLYNSYQIVEK